jgi:DNA polymerase-3 subunit delta
MDSLTFLDQAGRGKLQPIYVLYGDESFLKRQVLAALRQAVLGTADDAFGLNSYAGDKAVFASVRDELDTIPFLGSRRLVVVESADPFITKFRTLLEKYVGEPAANGVLVLDVKSWPASTKLAKLLASDATVVCESPKPFKLVPWCSQWAKSRYGKQLPSGAAQLLVDLVGPEMGLLDQELAKLAVYVGNANKVETEDVDKLVGRSRSENVWKIFDAIGAGRAKEALAMLDNLFFQGEEPLRLLGAWSAQLRRLAQIGRLQEQGLSLAAAMQRAGVAPYFQRGCEEQLRHLGRRRIDRIYEWLIDIDLGVKGSSQLPHRTLLERLVVQLARKS